MNNFTSVVRNAEKLLNIFTENMRETVINKEDGALERYINADKLEKDIKVEASESIASAVIRIIDRQPTEDVVESKCRCSECKHLKIINKEPVYAECERQKLTFLLWQADTREHYCSYGERSDT